MRRWRFGLQLRLILGFAAVLALSMSAAAVCTGFAAHREVSRLQVEQDRVRAVRIHSALADFYQDNQSWRDAQNFVNRIGFQSERHIVVLDADGNLIADNRYGPRRRDDHRRGGGDREPRSRFDRESLPFDSEPLPFDPENPRLDLPPPNYFLPIASDSDVVGAVAILAAGRGGPIPVLANPSPDATDETEPPLAQFTQRVNQTLILAGLVAGVSGVVLVLLFSRRVLGSIGNLTAAARRLGGGDLSSRAAIRGSDEVAELGRAFNAMADALEDSERQRRTMVSDIAHELRTPLSNIQGHVEAMQDGLLEPGAETLETVRRQSLHLNRLVDDLSLLAATESRELNLVMEEASVANLIRDVEASFRPRAEARSIRLATELEPDLPNLPFDRLRIEQVIGNLVDNAIRHTPNGGTVIVSAHHQDGGIRVTVSDTGAGIPPDVLPRVFDRLYRADPSRDRATGGSGLGLTIARQLVHAHGGRIWAESQPGQGSRFGFDLPAPQNS